MQQTDIGVLVIPLLDLEVLMDVSCYLGMDGRERLGALFV